ncbi:uncharacterized protein LOC127253142 isoform X2 [Andrographis paniculata]|uniref:uncharacterized protein LOC127253142 isoform X2 n=1 Tax=Andrographis paniculata TaxID=175694 RepID=UPI0021E947BA|nr:uncharacterized protein LOC127253142 isoform X2 [Andrographis paniculata]
MDSSPPQTAAPSIEEDEWDSEGFVIPSLGIEETDQNQAISSKAEDSKPSEAGKEDKIYLGPHGAPPSQGKQPVEQNSSNRKQRFKQKLKEADRRYSGVGRENKVDNLRELVGGARIPAAAPRSSSKEWLDSHCHESEFDRKRLH